MSVDMSDKTTTAIFPEITIESIKESDDIQFYTGLQNYESFMALYTTLVEMGFPNDSTGPKPKLRLVDEFLLVMMRLRLGLLVKDLEFRFKISASSVSRIFGKWIGVMSKLMKSLVFMPPLDVLLLNIPACFKFFFQTHELFWIVQKCLFKLHHL